MSAPPRIHITQKPTRPYGFLSRIYPANNFNSDESAVELLLHETSQKPPPSHHKLQHSKNEDK